MEFDLIDRFIFGNSDILVPENVENDCLLNQEHKNETSLTMRNSIIDDAVEKLLGIKGNSTKDLSDIICNETIIEAYNKLNLSRSREWTTQEDKLLLEYVAKYNSRNWKRISEIIKTKTPQQCTYRYQKLVNEMNHQKWNRKEDIKLYELIEIFGEDYNSIAKHFEGRTAKELEERFRKKLDPKLRNISFTEEEDALLYNLQKKYGNKWVIISKFFRDKEPEMIKQRFFNYIRKNFNKESNSYKCTEENYKKNSNDSSIKKNIISSDTRENKYYDLTINESFVKINAENEVTKNEFEQVFKTKSLYNNCNDQFMYELDYESFKKSETVSTQDISVKNDFNVDSFFEDYNKSFNKQIMNHSLSNPQENHLNTSIPNNSTFLYQIELYKEHFERILKFYNSKDVELLKLLESNTVYLASKDIFSNLFEGKSIYYKFSIKRDEG